MMIEGTNSQVNFKNTVEISSSPESRLQAFWAEKAKEDSFARFVVELLELHETEVNPNKALLITVDVQPAFKAGGGLPLTNGAEVCDLATEIDAARDYPSEIKTIDSHNPDNIGNAFHHQLPPFSFLSRNKAGEVMVGEKPYKEAVSQTVLNSLEQHGSRQIPLTLEQIEVNYTETKKYLEKQIIARTYVAAMLGTDCVTGVGQLLWPLHAIDQTEEERFADVNQEVRQTTRVFKGQHDETDSYSALIEGDGTPVMIDGRSVAALIQDQVNELKLDTILLKGLAFDFCVKFTAEGLRLAQEVYQLNEGFGDNETKLKVAFTTMLEKIPGMLVTLDLVDALLAQHKIYVEAKMMLKPDIKIVVAPDACDPVRGPGGINTDEDAKRVAEEYDQMGVKLALSTKIGA